MVLFDVVALECSKCERQCDPIDSGQDLSDLFACETCGYIACGDCFKNKTRCMCGTIVPHYSLLAQLCYFAIHAPADELGVIDLQTTSFVCDGCGCESNLYRSAIQVVLCDKCCPNTHNVWSTSSKLESRFLKIIRELKESCMPRTRARRAEVSGVLPLKILVKCSACGVSLTSTLCPRIVDDDPFCHSCFSDNSPDEEYCDCLWKFMALIECIPENQLGLLTFKKWMEDDECDDHLDLLKSLKAISASDGSTEKPLRSFFKNGELNPYETVSKSEEQASLLFDVSANGVTLKEAKAKRVATFLSTLKPTADQFVPPIIVCGCGREEELQNVFDCSTCSVYGVCSLCLANKHWGHDVKKSVVTLTPCLINSRSEHTFKKLADWVEEAAESNKQSAEKFKKLCEALRGTFKEAAKNSGDMQRVIELIGKADVSCLEKSFKAIIMNNRKAHRMIDDFCDSLAPVIPISDNTADFEEVIMVVLEVLKCAQCGDPCDRALINGTCYDISPCSKCDTLFCGKCRAGGHYCPRHRSRQEPGFLSSFYTFVNYGPEEEMRFIDLQTALNGNCSKCKCNLMFREAYRRNIQQVLCTGCYVYTSCPWQISTTLETIFCKVVRELNERAIMPRTRPQQAGVSDVLPVKIISNCHICQEELGMLCCGAIMHDGVPYCLSCGEQTHKYLPVSHRCDCLRRLIDFIQCIPENQLHLLTYSKWLRAIDCTQHQAMLYELKAVSADGSTTRELRSFFKKEDDFAHKFKPASSAIPEECSLSSALDPSTESVFPARIVRFARGYC